MYIRACAGPSHSKKRKEKETHTRRSMTSLVDNLLNRFRMASRTLRQVDNYFQQFQHGFEKYLNKQFSRQIPKKSALRAACIIIKSPFLKKFIRNMTYIRIETFSALRAGPFS